MVFNKIYDKIIDYFCKTVVVKTLKQGFVSDIQFKENQKENNITTTFSDTEKMDILEEESLQEAPSQKQNLDELISNVKASSKGTHIYWADMNASDVRGDTSHTRRPFIVINETKESQLTGFYTTSCLKNLHFSGRCFTKYRTVLSTQKYCLKKPSVVLHDHLVTLNQEQVLGYIDSVDYADLVKILKMSQLSAGKSLELSGKNLSCGDIVDFELARYLIYSKDRTFSYGLQILPTQNNQVDPIHDFHYFFVGQGIYEICFGKYSSISNTTPVVLMDHVGDNTLSVVENKRNQQKQYVKKSKVSK